MNNRYLTVFFCILFIDRSHHLKTYNSCTIFGKDNIIDSIFIFQSVPVAVRKLWQLRRLLWRQLGRLRILRRQQFQRFRFLRRFLRRQL